MRYEISHGKETFRVEVQEAGPHTYEVTVEDRDPVRVDAYKTARTVYSILIGARQYEGSVDELDDGTLNVHVGTSAFDFTAIDERRKLLAASGPGVASGRQTLTAQMPGKIVKLLVRVGDSVREDQSLMVIEAMKMENEIRSPIDGVVAEIGAREDEAVETGALLAVIEPPEQD